MAIPENLNIALLGLGRAGKFHIQSIQSIPGISLRCVVDVDESLARRLAKELQCDYSTDAEWPLGQADIDAVIVASPTQEHYGQIITALDAGKPVFTEKPLGSTLEEIDTCFGLAKRNELPLLVGFNRRFDPSFSSLARGVKEGQVGVLQMLRVTSRDSPLPTMDYIRTSHGIFHDCIVHDFDMLRFITGEDPVEIYSVGSSFVEGISALGDLDNVLVALKYAGGMIASIAAARSPDLAFIVLLAGPGVSGQQVMRRQRTDIWRGNGLPETQVQAMLAWFEDMHFEMLGEGSLANAGTRIRARSVDEFDG